MEASTQATDHPIGTKPSSQGSPESHNDARPDLAEKHDHHIATMTKAEEQSEEDGGGDLGFANPKNHSLDEILKEKEVDIVDIKQQVEHEKQSQAVSAQILTKALKSKDEIIAQLQSEIAAKDDVLKVRISLLANEKKINKLLNDDKNLLEARNEKFSRDKDRLTQVKGKSEQVQCKLTARMQNDITGRRAAESNSHLCVGHYDTLSKQYQKLAQEHHGLKIKAAEVKNIVGENEADNGTLMKMKEVIKGVEDAIQEHTAAVEMNNEIKQEPEDNKKHLIDALKKLLGE